MIEITISGLIGIGCGVIIGNYIWQMFQKKPDWGLAFERSYFQILALFCVGVIGYI